ncbi:platelet-derived growth factor subunit A-like protein [Leptotrombidium deliense]|uniref:Platelet-derived growth factor subunit A-like protein n=1 Tax=Leptotrombidium deliense TaxID=299467 RepID=A0A443SK59_9ACAR|nr:platelet-derived growth factor subunit A-like protein [Leptotrombidium deliense]
MLAKEVIAFALLVCRLVSVEAFFGRDSNNDAKLAAIHLSKITKEAKCKKPLPRVVHIEELHPNARKKYLPHCTVLHFCGQETGCCRQENEICSPKTIEEVTLNFWVVELTAFGKRKGVEKMTFLNHTECDCISPIGNSTRSTSICKLNLMNI